MSNTIREVFDRRLLRSRLATVRNGRSQSLDARLIRALANDAAVLVTDYFSGLPEHRAPVDAAMTRLDALLFDDDPLPDEDES